MATSKHQTGALSRALSHQKHLQNLEARIRHENGAFWVWEDKDAFTVYRAGVTHSTPDSSYAPTDDGLSLAIYRCDYLAKRKLSN